MFNPPSIFTVQKCLRFQGTKPAYYYEDGSRVVVRFMDASENDREYSWKDFTARFVTCGPTEKTREILAGMPVYREWLGRDGV